MSAIAAGQPQDLTSVKRDGDSAVLSLVLPDAKRAKRGAPAAALPDLFVAFPAFPAHGAQPELRLGAGGPPLYPSTVFPMPFASAGDYACDIAVREPSAYSERRCANNYAEPAPRHDRVIWLSDDEYVIA
jgi:hypothetical protein